MRFINFFLLLIFVSVSLKTQAQNFKKGTVITIAGDTLQGFIADEAYEKLSKQILFKPNKKEVEPTVYTAHDLRSFEFADGDFFISHSVSFSSKHSKEYNSDMRFLHRLYRNEKTSLYELNDWQENPLFIQKLQGEIILLCLGRDGNPAYLEEIAYIVNDCKTLVVSGNLALDANAIEAVLVDYDQCGKEAKPKSELPELMAWAGVAAPTFSVARKYDGIGQSFQLELRPFPNGMLSNMNIGVEYFNFNSTNSTMGSDYEYRTQTKRQELSIKSRFFLSALNGHLRPYGFLALTSHFYESKSSYRYYNSQDFLLDRSKSEFAKLVIHPGIGVHGQWRGHIFRLELPLTSEMAFVKIGYGHAF